MLNLRNDEDIIKQYGLKDGHDEARLEYAKDCAKEFDRPLWIMFEGLIRLEQKGLIKIMKDFMPEVPKGEYQ